jgi:hypothetical protein
MKAEPYDCDLCRRHIGTRGPHCVTENDLVICGRCLHAHGTHTRVYPDCRRHGHDMYDHGLLFATRAVVHVVKQRGGFAAVRHPDVSSARDLRPVYNRSRRRFDYTEVSGVADD